MEVVNHLEDSLKRVSTGNLYTPTSMHTRAHRRAHTHTHTRAYIICDYLSTCADMDGNLQLHWKSYKQCLRNSTFYWAVIMAHLSGSQMLCQPHNWFTATSVRIFEERRKLMSSFHSSVAKKIMVIRDSQIENTEINSISKSLCADRKSVV